MCGLALQACMTGCKKMHGQHHAWRFMEAVQLSHSQQDGLAYALLSVLNFRTSLSVGGVLCLPLCHSYILHNQYKAAFELGIKQAAPHYRSRQQL